MDLMKILDIFNYLIQTRADRKAALVRHFTEKHIEIRDPVLVSVLEITVAHGQLVKIAEHGQVQLLLCFHHTPQNLQVKLPVLIPLDYMRGYRKKQSFLKI